MRSDITAGSRLPDYELVDHANITRSLSELQRNDPLILVLARGNFCPKCREQHRELVRLYPMVSVSYTAIVTVTTEDVAAVATFRDTVGASWPFLSDEARVIQRDLEIQEYTDPVHDPMIPHTFVLAPGLTIHRIYNGYWFWGRPSADELRRDLREITRRIRPDWDLATAGLRDAWERGDRTLHYPYQPVQTR